MPTKGRPSRKVLQQLRPSETTRAVGCHFNFAQPMIFQPCADSADIADLADVPESTRYRTQGRRPGGFTKAAREIVATIIAAPFLLRLDIRCFPPIASAKAKYRISYGRLKKAPLLDAAGLGGKTTSLDKPDAAYSGPIASGKTRIVAQPGVPRHQETAGANLV